MRNFSKSIQSKMFAALLLFWQGGAVGNEANQSKEVGTYSLETIGRFPVVHFEGKPAELFWHYIIQSGTNVFDCAGEKAVQSSSMICLKSKMDQMNCYSRVSFGGKLTPDSDRCPQPSVIGVGN